MNKFNRLYEDIFKPASAEEVSKRKEESKLEEFKEWVTGENGLNLSKYEDLFKPENINKEDESGDNALIIAADLNSKKIVELLINNKADINFSTDYGDTALHYSTGKNNYELTEFLLRKGINSINKLNSGGNSPLHYAVQNENKDLVKLLLRYGASPNIGAVPWATPIANAKTKRLSAIVKLLNRHITK